MFAIYLHNRLGEKLKMQNFLFRTVLIFVSAFSATLSIASDRDETREMTDRANAGVWAISTLKSYEALARTCSNNFPDMLKDFESTLVGLNDRNRELVTKAEIARERILRHVEKLGGKEKAKTYAQVLESRVEHEVASTIKRVVSEDRSFCKRYLRVMSSGEWDIRNRDMGAYRKLMQ
jgi:predicted  nucleic acid-binding Zn-ribbon protein